MKKSTKGALAAAAAGTLLLGGAGTLAFWTDGATVDGSTITAGTLTLDQDACGDWQLDGVGGVGGDLAGRLLVPGDTLTKQCTYTIVGTGDHLEAALDVATPDWSGDLASKITTDADFTITPDGGSPSVVTAGTPYDFEEGTYTVTADFSVDFPYGVEDNSSKGLSAAIADIGLSVTQTDNH